MSNKPLYNRFSGSSQRSRQHEIRSHQREPVQGGPQALEPGVLTHHTRLSRKINQGNRAARKQLESIQ